MATFASSPQPGTKRVESATRLPNGAKTLEAIQVVEVEASRRARSDGFFRMFVERMTKVTDPGAGS